MRTLNDTELKATWQRWRSHKCETARNQLLEHYMPVARFHANQIRSKLPEQVDVEDLASAGIFGLVDALSSYEPERGFKFETYCSRRVHGAIIDSLRSMDWVPRLVRSRSAQINQVSQTFLLEKGRLPTDAELAELTNCESHEEFERIQRDSNPHMLSSLDRTIGNNGNGRECRELDVIEDESQSHPHTLFEREDVKEFVTRGLSTNEKLIVTLYYYENLTMREIGKVLDLSESRVSQMRASIIGRLKATLAGREDELVREDD